MRARAKISPHAACFRRGFVRFIFQHFRQLKAVLAYNDSYFLGQTFSDIEHSIEMSNDQLDDEMKLYGVHMLLKSPTHDTIGDVVKAIFMDNIDNYRQHFFTIQATAVSIDHTFKASVP